MNISYLKGEWPVLITDIDVKNITDEQVQFIGHAVSNNAVVVIKGQKLTVDDEAAFGRRFGPIEIPLLPENARRSINREHPSIATVTGQLDRYGKPGLHGMDEELDWHCGSPALKARPDIVYLYSVTGSAGSRTTYVNSIESYADLSDEWKDRIKDLRLIPTRGGNKYTTMFETFGLGPQAVAATDYTPNVVHTNNAGKKCIYLPVFQMAGFAGYENRKDEEAEIYEYLKNHMLSEKYMYHHDWDDGDIIMWDNWTGLHKRWAFAHMDQRILHRMEWNFANKK